MDKFTKVRNIGKGNMGACALARNNEDGKYYVIKQVDLTRMNKKERQQSLNEARVLSSLRHPNIINYVDSFLARKSDHLCIVMEFADGGDLNSRIKKNYGVNFRETQVLDWFIQVVLSLHYVHQRKILHRDVKTQNIFLTSDGQVKLGDFGIARTLSNTYDQAKTFVGTPYYLSPELILERPYDHRSDVWAAGVVLYELLTLKHPFNASDMKGLMQRILKVQYDPIPMMYSTEMRNLVPRLLVKDPAKRIRLSEILDLPLVNHRLSEWLSGDIVPKKYVETLLSQNLLPEAIVALTRGVEAPPPPVSVTSVDSAKGVFEGSLDGRKKRQLPPLQPVEPATEETDTSPPESSTVAAVDPAEESKPTPGTECRSSSTQDTGTGTQGKETPASEAEAVAQPKEESPRIPSRPPVRTGEKALNHAKPLRNPAMYRYYKPPAVPMSARNPIQLNSDNPGPTRLNSHDNFYHQVNYYQRAQNNKDLYRHYSHGQYLNPNVPALRRNPSGVRMENGQAAAHLVPLFHGNNNNPNVRRPSRQTDVTTIIQKAAARRRMGT